MAQKLFAKFCKRSILTLDLLQNIANSSTDSNDPQQRLHCLFTELYNSTLDQKSV